MKTFIGKVKSCKMKKTVVIEVETQRAHPLYKKFMKKTRKFKVHNENLNLKTGDKVMFIETKPISKEKRWKIVKKI